MNIHFKIITSFVFILTFVSSVDARSVDPKSVYGSVGSIAVPSIKIPTVIELPVPKLISQPVVFDDTTAQFVPSLFRASTLPILPKEIKISGSESSMSNSDLKFLADNNYETFFESDLPESGRGVINLNLIYPKPIRTNSLNLSLPQYATLPIKVSIRAMISNSLKPIVLDIVPNTSIITFPEYVSDNFEITLEYGQPLRVSELTLNNLNASPSTETLRFLASSDHEYKLYANPQYVPSLNLGESGNLQDDMDVIKIPTPSMTQNSLFKETDSDEDGINDALDNCVRVSNTDQKDENGNGRGDMCDDYDKDSVINSLDNCVNAPNRDQIDTDRDGKGDACDTEESRLTEKYPALVWGAIVFAVLVFISLFYVVLRKNGSQVNSK